MQTTNSAGLALIEEFEGLRLDAYPDPAHGWSVPTIGIGHTSAAGPPTVYRGMKITAAEAREILRRDVRTFEASVRKLVTVPLSDNQFAALVSFTFNLGATNLAKSTLLRKLNRGDYLGAAAEFPKWSRAGGRVLSGLVRRREAERALFMSQDRTVHVTSQARPEIHAPQPIPSLWDALRDFFNSLFRRA